ncbi:MAG: hypothetical protein JSU88_09530 [Nitrospinaceae bacterium]|jgi:hypothetical protein|nr:MAG: hypothetical protein JSU88_09530 [Nitrospinaceae bacterium]
MNENIEPQAAPAPNCEADEKSTAQVEELEIDLNHLFPGEETDLNVLFPDEDIKRLLKNISKNKKDLHAIKERISDENVPASDAEENEASTGEASENTD